MAGGTPALPGKSLSDCVLDYHLYLTQNDCMKNLISKLLLAGGFLILICTPATPTQAAQQKGLVTLRGRVVDARTGEPIAKVRVIANGTEQSTTTDANGEFTLENLPAGKVDLYITTVSYGLVKKVITLKEGENPAAVIALNEEAATLTESVTVTTAPFETTGANTPSEQRLNKKEIQELSSVLVGDPVRAAQSLPGATANDDFRSEFAIRGFGLIQRKLGNDMDPRLDRGIQPIDLGEACAS